VVPVEDAQGRDRRRDDGRRDLGDGPDGQVAVFKGEVLFGKERNLGATDKCSDTCPVFVETNNELATGHH